MNPQEWRATFALGGIYALRMFGMFMVLPVFPLYARGLPGGATPVQIGLAIGAYGLVQAILQIPLGALSDRIGRKPVIVAGLLLFALGSFVAGSTHDIHWIVLGRAIQGAGAISAAVSALIADVTRDAVRSQAMMVVGAGLGVSFVLALLLGPIFSGWIGVDGIFTLTGALALLAIPVVLFGVQAVPRGAHPSIAGWREMSAVLADGSLLRLDFGILLLHAMMTALFMAAPLVIEQTLGLPGEKHWEVYLPVLIVSVLIVFPLMRKLEARGLGRIAFRGAVALLGLALLAAAALHASRTGFIAAMLAFFIGFNYLEGTLPSIISRRVPAARRGAALGVYSTAQFLGGPLGSAIGGLARQHAGLGAVFACASLLSALWLALEWRLDKTTAP